MGCGMRELPVLAVVGGFLGAGKTTLLPRAAALLRDGGVRAAVITNDQGEGLVDTRAARAAGFEAGEVAGGCFCCRFSELVRWTPPAACSNTSRRSSLPSPWEAAPYRLYRAAAAQGALPRAVPPGALHRVGGPRRGAAPAGRRGRLAHGLAVFEPARRGGIAGSTKTDLSLRVSGVAAAGGLPRMSAETGEGVREWLRELFAGTRIARAGECSKSTMRATPRPKPPSRG